MELADVVSLKRGLMSTHFEEGLNEDDEHFIDSVALVDNPLGILYHVKSLKEEGNLMFRKGNFSVALDKYFLAVKYLSFIMLENEEEKLEFFDLALSLLLNEAACSLKLLDYYRAGQLCSVVLESDSRNVKAYYRRAMAALGLGEFYLAHLDLTKAAEFDPSNKEVGEKLKNVGNQLLHKAIGISESNGLGKSKQSVNDLSSSEIQASKVSSPQIKECEDEAEVFKPKGGIGMLPRRSVRVNPEKGLQGQQMEVDVSVPSSKSSQDQQMDIDVSVQSSESSQGVPQETGLVGTSPDVASIDSSPPLEKTYLAEPIYRFVNRRRGSFLHISPSNYEALKQGKILSFFNSSQGAVMKIRALTKNCTPTNPEVKCEASDDQMCSKESAQGSSSTVTTTSDFADDASSLESITSVPIAEICTSRNIFRFTVRGKRRSTYQPVHPILPIRNPKERCRRLRVFKRRCSAVASTNDVSGCRLVSGMKRKFISSSLNGPSYPPPKKALCLVTTCSLVCVSSSVGGMTTCT